MKMGWVVGEVLSSVPVIEGRQAPVWLCRSAKFETLLGLEAMVGVLTGRRQPVKEHFQIRARMFTQQDPGLSPHQPLGDE
jgi:hypothetical protein